MKGRNLVLALPALVLALGCDNPQQPKGVRAPTGPSKIISDGAYGGNPDFFFLPPLVPFPFRNPDFELGKFNNALTPSLSIEICALIPEPLNALPTSDTECGATVKTFERGTVQLVNLPRRQNGWWAAFGLPADGFYYVLWNTSQPGLDPSLYYRIKVSQLLNGTDVPLAIADVDPMSNLREWRFARTGQVVQMINGTMLPIPFRVENTSGLCTSPICTQQVVTNESGGPDPQVVTVSEGGGAIAGASFPDGWLPSTGPQSVVVTISEVPSDENEDRSRITPCHDGLPLQQFNKCFKFTTTPTLAAINPAGDQFAEYVTVAVCYRLYGTEDPREEFGELYASGPTETTRALEDVDDVGILDPDGRGCPESNLFRGSNPLTRLAMDGWRKVKGGLGQVFGVKTAYAVDVGLGGIIKGFTNIGVAVSAHVAPATVLGRKLAYGEIRRWAVRLTGTQYHHVIEGDPLIEGIDNLPVTFNLSPGGGGLSLDAGVGTETQVAVRTDLLNDAFLGIEGVGFAPIHWTTPNVRGVHRLTVTSPAFGGQITFTDTVRGARLMLSMQTGATFQMVTLPPLVNNWVKVGTNPAVTVSSTGLVTAVTGGENINGGNAVTLRSTVGGVEAHTALVNSFAFDIWPRQTTLVWKPVAGALSYDVVTEFGTGCGVGGNCATWSEPATTTFAAGVTKYTFGFVGSQPGRWRVVARGADNVILSTSPFIYFGYNI